MKGAESPATAATCWSAASASLAAPPWKTAPAAKAADSALVNISAAVCAARIASGRFRARWVEPTTWMAASCTSDTAPASRKIDASVRRVAAGLGLKIIPTIAGI